MEFAMNEPWSEGLAPSALGVDEWDLSHEDLDFLLSPELGGAQTSLQAHERQDKNNGPDASSASGRFLTSSESPKGSHPSLSGDVCSLSAPAAQLGEAADRPVQQFVHPELQLPLSSQVGQQLDPLGTIQTAPQNHHQYHTFGADQPLIISESSERQHHADHIDWGFELPVEGSVPRRHKPHEGEKGSALPINLKEKNRATQRRYRERQKEKLHASEEKIAVLSNQLQTMQLEQQTLSKRNAMLERLLAMQQAACQHTTPTGGRHPIEAQKDAWWLDKHMKVYMEHEMNLGKELVLTIRRAAPIWLSKEQVVALGEEGFDALWTEYMQAFAALLIEACGDPETRAGLRLAQLVHEACQIKASMLISHPSCAHYKVARSAADSKGSDEVWVALVDSSCLSEQQRRVIVSLRRVYLYNLGLLSRQRQELTLLLQAELPMAGVCMGPKMVSDVYSRTLSTMSTLQDTLRNEHVCLLQFILTVVRRVLTPMQVAHIHVTSHPGHADIMRIAEVLAQQAGEPRSCVVMGSAAAKGKDAKLQHVESLLPESMKVFKKPNIDLAALYPHLSPDQLVPPKSRGEWQLPDPWPATQQQDPVVALPGLTGSLTSQPRMPASPAPFVTARAVA